MYLLGCYRCDDLCTCWDLGFGPYCYGCDDVCVCVLMLAVVHVAGETSDAHAAAGYSVLQSPGQSHTHACTYICTPTHACTPMHVHAYAHR